MTSTGRPCLAVMRRNPPFRNRKQPAAIRSRPDDTLRGPHKGNRSAAPPARPGAGTDPARSFRQRYNVPSSAPAQTVPSGVSVSARTAGDAALSFVPKIRRSFPAHNAMPVFVPIHTRPAWSVKMDLMPCTSHAARCTRPSSNSYKSSPSAALNHRPPPARGETEKTKFADALVADRKAGDFPVAPAAQAAAAGANPDRAVAVFADRQRRVRAGKPSAAPMT